MANCYFDTQNSLFEQLKGLEKIILAFDFITEIKNNDEKFDKIVKSTPENKTQDYYTIPEEIVDSLKLYILYSQEFKQKLLQDKTIEKNLKLTQVAKLKLFNKKTDRKSTRLNSSHRNTSRMPSSA